jgi:hypothetical protein
MLSKNGCENKKNKILCREPRNSPRQRNFLRKCKQKEEKPKENAKKTFAESQIRGSRQRKCKKKLCRELDRGLSAKKLRKCKKTLPRARSGALGKENTKKPLILL